MYVTEGLPIRSSLLNSIYIEQSIEIRLTINLKRNKTFKKNLLFITFSGYILYERKKKKTACHIICEKKSGMSDLGLMPL